MVRSKRFKMFSDLFIFETDERGVVETLQAVLVEYCFLISESNG